MLKKHWRLLLVLIVVLILSFYLYRTYYLEGNTSEPDSGSGTGSDSDSGTGSDSDSGPESGPEYNLTAEQERTVNAIKEDLIASFYKVNNNYSEGEQNSGNSEENVDLSDAINRLKNLSQEEEMS
jgi:hypothetical protein